MDNQIYKLPICPQCRETKYVFEDVTILRSHRHCDRCSISWSLRDGKVTKYLDYYNEGERYVTPLKRRIIKEAERVWEESGKPEGRSEDIWFVAEQNVLSGI